MIRVRTVLGLVVAASLLLAFVACSSSDKGEAREEPAHEAARADPALVTDGTAEIPEDETAQQAHASMLDREFPLHGLVTGLQLRVRERPDPESDVVGWLRIGGRVRVKSDPHQTATCRTGWYGLYPRGFACAGQGIEVGETPPESEMATAPPERDAALPYRYWYVKDPATPEYYRAPSRNEQRAARAYAERYLELLNSNESRAARFLAGELPNEPEKPAVMHRLLERGFVIAGAGIEVRAFRNFVRSVRGRFVKQSRLIERMGSELTGVELSEERTLPIAWTVRTARPLIKRDRADGTIRWVDDAEVEPLERHTVLEDWIRRENVGGHYMHILEGERYLRDWFVAIAEPHERPAEIGQDEPWVHVNLGRQTLVLYEGDRPVFTTLVSTGLEDFATPPGTYNIRSKYIADTMANLGGGMDDRYSIEDVPWTQYFEGSFALHGAFWHTHFGLQKSHGCVNLSPRDAHRVFDALWPRVPEGWLGVSTDGNHFKSSHVVITE